MPQNLPEQILQWIFRLSADGNSQREVARMLGVSQGCISKILRRNRETADHIRGSMEVRWKSSRHGKIVNCSEWSDRTALSRLLVCECRWSADLGGRCQFEPFKRWLLATGYWSQHPARCPRLTLEHRRRRREWGRRHKVWDPRQWRDCIFSDESQFSLYHSDGRVRVRRRQGERLIDGRHTRY